MRKTLSKLIALGALGFSLGCVNIPRHYDTVYQDVDGDGKADAISYDFIDYYVVDMHDGTHIHRGMPGLGQSYDMDYAFYFAHGNGNGTFGPKKPISKPIHGEISEFAVKDFDGDGKADLFYVFGTKKMLAKGRGDGTFEPAREIQTDSTQ